MPRKTLGGGGHYSYIWKTTGPPSTSSPFSYNDFRWRLQFRHADFCYWLELEIVSSPTGQDEPFRPFRVTCFARHGDVQDGFGIKVSECTSASLHCLWKESQGSIYRKTGSVMCGMTETEFVVVFRGPKFESGSIARTDKHSNTSLGEAGLSSDFAKLLASGDASDVQLTCGGVTRAAHRSVLAARSEVFAAMFRNQMAECCSGVVELEHLDATLLDLLLQYVYTGKVSDIPEGRVHELYAVADKYAVHLLKKTCSDWMIENLSEDDYQKYLTMADAHNDEQFQNAVVASVVDHPEWLKSEAWRDFSKEHPNLAVEVYREYFDKTNK